MTAFGFQNENIVGNAAGSSRGEHKSVKTDNTE